MCREPEIFVESRIGPRDAPANNLSTPHDEASSIRMARVEIFTFS